MFTPLNTFDDVVARYESIKPINKAGALNTDVRPLGSRQRPYERIIKLDDNTYALSDGNYAGWGYPETNNQVITVGSAILWKRESDGDYIHIRNSPRGVVWPSRLLFISTYLPSVIRLITGQERPHGQQVYIDGKCWPLPNLHTQRIKDSSSGKPTVEHVEDMSLVFKVLPDGTFVRHGEILFTTKKIDTERKKEMLPMFNEFYEYMLTMAPFAEIDWHGLNKGEQYLRERDMTPKNDREATELARHFMTAPIEDEGKVLFAQTLLYRLNYQWVGDNNTLKEFRKRYNKWCTDAFDLYVREAV